MSYYSQCGQDSYLNEKVFFNKRNGFFVDIGSNDGVTYSNTYFFEKDLNWNGICFEPMPHSYDKLRKNRQCHCIEGAVSSKNGERDFLLVNMPNIAGGDMLSGFLDTMDPRHLSRIDSEIKLYGGTKKIIQVKTYLLADVLMEMNIDKVDFVSIDTEGSELEIIKSIDFESLDIYCLVVENNYGTADVEDYLKKKGYILKYKCPQDDIYIKKIM